MMLVKRRRLESGALSAFCALALAASMALPFMGASKSYAEEAEAPAIEGAQTEPSQDEADASEVAPVSEEGTATEPQSTEKGAADQPAGKAASYTVTFGTAAPQTVAEGGTVTAPALGDREYAAWTSTSPQLVKTTAKFAGWYCVDPDFVSDSKGPLSKEGHYGGFGFRDVDAADKIGVLADYELAEFKDGWVFYAGNEQITVNGTMELRALYTYKTVPVSLGSYLVGIGVNEYYDYSTGGFPKGWTLGKSGIGDGYMNETVLKQHPDFVLKGYYYGKDGKPTDKLFPLDTPITENVEVWQVYVRSNEPLSVSGTEGFVASGTLSGPNIPVNANVSVNAAKAASGEARDSLVGKLGDTLFGDVFEVILLADGKEIHDGFGELTLSFPVGEENDGYNFTVYHRHQDGRITSEPAVAENGVVTITVTDLSSFALAKGEKAGAGAGTEGEVKPLGGSALAQTGDATPVLAFGGFALAALGAVAFAGRRAWKSACK